MEFLITALDGTDSKAIDRRLACRTAHLELGNKMISDGSLVYAAAILDESDRMIGSLMIVDFSSRAEVDGWLKIEPYVVGDVWREVKVDRCRSGPAFANSGKR